MRARLVAVGDVGIGVDGIDKVAVLRGAARQLRFTTRPLDIERFDFFHAGTYRLVLWLALASRPTPEEAERWVITLDDVDARRLQSRSEMGIARTVAVLKD